MILESKEILEMIEENGALHLVYARSITDNRLMLTMVLTYNDYEKLREVHIKGVGGVRIFDHLEWSEIILSPNNLTYLTFTMDELEYGDMEKFVRGWVYDRDYDG